MRILTMIIELKERYEEERKRWLHTRRTSVEDEGGISGGGVETAGVENNGCW